MSTQMKYARDGLVTDAMQVVAKDEGLTPELVRGEVASGRMIIAANVHHKNLKPIGIGISTRCKTRIRMKGIPHGVDIYSRVTDLIRPTTIQRKQTEWPAIPTIAFGNTSKSRPVRRCPTTGTRSENVSIVSVEPGRPMKRGKYHAGRVVWKIFFGDSSCHGNSHSLEFF